MNMMGLADVKSFTGPTAEKKIDLHEHKIDSQKSMFFYWKISVFDVQNLS